MDCVINNEFLIHLLVNYGSIVLFVLLALGIIALPIPEETLMVMAGIFMRQGILLIPFTFLAALLGSMCGISISYMIGKTGGTYLIHKYGSWAGLTEERVHKVKDWFHHYGKWTISIGYFIPGVRHLTGVVAGSTELEFRYFALFAFAGALAWVSTFLAVGYFFGDLCLHFLADIEISTETLVLGALAIIALYLLYRWFKNKK